MSRPTTPNGGLVPDEGDGTERLVVVGEAPGAHEVVQRRPFIGPSGYRLDQWMAQAGLQRPDAYLTNVYPFQAPSNVIERVAKADLAAWTDRLHDRLAGLDHPGVIVPTGNTALKALIGRPGISKWRGSIVAYTDRRSRPWKVIPTIHPAATFRTPAWEPRCLADWRRIASDLAFPELRHPERTHDIRPSLDTLAGVLDEVTTSGTTIAVDVETPGPPRNRVLTCVGVALSPSYSVTIPLGRWYWRSDHEAAEALALVRRIMAAPCEKVLQNGLFDAWWLARVGAPIRHWRWDTLAMHHALDAAESHSLDFMASLYTRQPFWKHMADPKDSGDGRFAKFEASRWDTFGEYNGIDCCVTLELQAVLVGMLERRGLLDFYDRHYRQMFQPLLALMRHGIRLNDAMRRRRFTRLMSRCVSLQDQLTKLAGAPLYGPKGDLSSKKVQQFLYDGLRLPKRLDRKTGNPTAKETVVRQLMLRHPAVMAEPGRLLLEHRRTRKLTEFLAERIVDPDGRVRCTMKFTTATGRLASAKNPGGTGRNLQNIDREVRDAYVPDHEGWVFVEADLSQAESRVVYVLTGDPELVELARTPPWAFDVHTLNASRIFQVAPEAVTKDQRYLGKRGIHAAHYGMMGGKLSDILLNDGYERTMAECQTIINAYMAWRPAIPEWHRATRQAVMRDRRLRTSWGRELSFEYARLSDDIYREAYAFVPQSEVGDLLNQRGLIPLARELRRRRLRARLNGQIHDALLVSCPPEEAYEVARIMRDALEHARTYQMPGEPPVDLMIPVEIKVGLTWAMKPGHEWKRFPTQADFDQAVSALLATAPLRVSA